MAQQVIKGLMFSPVLAHELEPGDTITEPVNEHGEGGWPVRINGIETYDGGVTLFVDFGGWGVVFDRNEPVLRAVGARASRGGAR